MDDTFFSGFTEGLEPDGPGVLGRNGFLTNARSYSTMQESASTFTTNPD